MSCYIVTYSDWRRNMRLALLTIAAIFIAAPTLACGLDGAFGVHRYNPFAQAQERANGMRAIVLGAQRTAATIQEPRGRADQATKSKYGRTKKNSPSPSKSADELRKWEVERGAAVAARVKATFT